MRQLPGDLVCGEGLLLAGCRSTLVRQTPLGHEGAGPTGCVLVFSRLESRIDNGSLDAGNLTGEILTGSPNFYQHTAYSIYDQGGKRIKRVGNTVGHYSEAPRVVKLPPGNYTVKAEAKCYDWVEVPVQIQSGRTTIVHLDKQWRPPPSSKTNELVSLPGGYAVGWRAGSSERSEQGKR